MTNWIEHDGGPQPVGDDVWVEAQWPFAGAHFSGEPDEMEQASELPWEGCKLHYRILNQHLIDAARKEGLQKGLEVYEESRKADAHHTKEVIERARLEGIRLGLEAAARACQAQAEEFLSPSYAVNQPLSSFAERFACGRCADEIRDINPDTIAREAVLDQLTREAQAQGMGYDTSAGTTA